MRTATTPSPATDHPRSRGVYRMGPVRRRCACGSSPLVRGLLVGEHGFFKRMRIIPARAGFTPATPTTCPSAPDHPRSRGVYSVERHIIPAIGGSSPLARGLRRSGVCHWCFSWIIPARAGFTKAKAPSPSGPRDHPRSRGVYVSRARDASASHGSSPLARGLQVMAMSAHSHHRIIPARAGFTRRGSRSEPTKPDHPRSRGVYCCCTHLPSASPGSSPLARGLPPSTRTGRRPRRIIPARAGFTASGAPTASHGEDHPRSRGVYSWAVARAIGSGGSSPLARGLQKGTENEHDRPGIIPARAGFTRKRWRPRSGRRDHPRSRGVYRTSRCPRWSRSGSSPLARGLRRHARPLRTPRRIIPARAGFTAVRGSPPGLRGDHPRSRGVYRSLDRDRSRATGSSPLARGLPSPGWR